MADRATVGASRLVRMDPMTGGDDKRSPCAETARVIDLASITAEEWYEVGRRAVEDQLIWMRDERISTLGRNNGLVVKELDGRESSVIRMSIEDALRIGMNAIFEARASQSDEVQA